jgi:hypothetical protein
VSVVVHTVLIIFSQKGEQFFFLLLLICGKLPTQIKRPHKVKYTGQTGEKKKNAYYSFSASVTVF